MPGLLLGVLKGEGGEADNMQFGSTLSADAFPAREFDFMLSNPPYGKSWKTDLERMGGKADITDPRFVVEHGGDSDYSLITRSSDGQMSREGVENPGWARYVGVLCGGCARVARVRLGEMAATRREIEAQAEVPVDWEKASARRW